MRHITLTETETAQLEDLYKNCPNSVVRQRSLCILLSSKGYSMLEVSIMLDIHRHTVRRLANKWDRASDEDKLLVLYTAKGQGAKLKLESVAELLPSLVERHNRNLKPILDTLEKDHGIKVCKQTLRNFLKGTGL